MKNSIIIAVVGILVGFGLGTKIFPTIKEKTVEVQVDKVVKDVQTVIKVVTRPDGTKEEITTIVDRTKENKEYSNTKTVSKNDWHISANAGRSFSDSNIIYGIQVERRVLGDVYLGALATTDKRVGISVGIDF
jgi:xanthosine utilization system XapX-like protein